MKSLAVYGTGSIAEQIYQYNERYHLYNICVFIDDNLSSNYKFHGIEVLNYETFKRSYTTGNISVIVTIGYSKCNTIRESVCLKLMSDGYILANFISPGSNCWPGAIVGLNIIIFDNVFVGNGSKISSGVIIYECVSIAHNVHVNKYSLLSLGVVAGGNSVIGEYTFVGLNSTIKSSVVLGNYNIVASGTNVIKSSNNYSLIKGNPGKVKNIDTLLVKI